MRYNGIIYERIFSNGKIKIYWKDKSSNDIVIFLSQLPKQPLETSIAVVNALSQREIYKYATDRIINPLWINLVLLPNEYTHITYKRNVPVPKPNWRSTRLTLPLHNGPYIAQSSNGNTGYLYFNPNMKRRIRIKSDIVIAPINSNNSSMIGDFNIISNFTKAENNLIDKIIKKITDDLRNPKIKKIEQPLKSLQDFGILLLLDNRRSLTNALNRIEGILVGKSKGKHQYKVKNLKNGKSAPIPDHSKGYAPWFPRKITRQLGIPYEKLLEAAK